MTITVFGALHSSLKEFFKEKNIQNIEDDFKETTIKLCFGLQQLEKD